MIIHDELSAVRNNSCVQEGRACAMLAVTLLQNRLAVQWHQQGGLCGEAQAVGCAAGGGGACRPQAAQPA